MTTMLPLLAALYAGIAGSMHCVSMCGGIAALGGAGATRPVGHVLLFNLGRILSYALAGALGAALVGVGLKLTPSPTTRIAVALLTGGVLAALGVYFALGWRAFAWIEAAGAGLWRRLQPLTRPLLPIRRPDQALALGALWGWLPCGLVYMMLPLAWATGSPGAGALVMAVFGLGTAPAMVGIGLGGSGLRAALRRPSIRRCAGATMVLFGLLMASGPWLFPHGGHRAHAPDHAVAALGPQPCSQENANAP